MKNNPIYFIVLLILLWLLGSASNIFHMRKVNNRIIHFKKKYRQPGLYMGVVSEKVSRLRKVILILIADKNGEIVECEYLYGITNFAKFKKRADLVGQSIYNKELVNKDKFKDAFKSSINIIIQQIKKEVKIQADNNNRLQIKEGNE